MDVVDSFWELRIKHLVYGEYWETTMKNIDSLFFSSLEECMAYILSSELDVRKIEIIRRNLSICKTKMTLNDREDK